MGPPLGEAMEFLSQALSQRGPEAVPYAENVKYTIREHMSELLKVGAVWSPADQGGGRRRSAFCMHVHAQGSAPMPSTHRTR